MNVADLSEINPSAIVWDGLDGAIVGVANKTAGHPILVTYFDKGEFHTYEIEDNDDEPLDIWGRIEFGPIIAYDTDKIIDILVNNMESVEQDLGEKYDEAVEYFEFNILNAWVGEYTPIHLPMKEVH